MADPANPLIIMSDEHNPKMLSTAGHPLVETPHLDALADGGTTFEAAYCNSPVCIPARGDLGFSVPPGHTPQLD